MMTKLLTILADVSLLDGGIVYVFILQSVTDMYCLLKCNNHDNIFIIVTTFTLVNMQCL